MTWQSEHDDRAGRDGVDRGAPAPEGHRFGPAARPADLAGAPGHPGYHDYPEHPAYPGHSGYPGPGTGDPRAGTTGAAWPVPSGPGYPPDPAAPYGRNPRGLPYSEKSKVAAGLLQIFVGGLGAGRFYLGHTKIALAQLLLHVGGILLYVLAFIGMAAVATVPTLDGPTEEPPAAALALTFGAIGLGIALVAGGALWAFVDGILILCDRVPDSEGRPLRS